MKAGKWCAICVSLILSVILLFAGLIAVIDPYFHYHKPVSWYYYDLRPSAKWNMNNGIMRHFDYDAMIIGTSMIANCKTSELDALMGTHSIKIPFWGATYKEINDNTRDAIRYNPSLKYVIRSLDYEYICIDKDEASGASFPDYLYDDDLLNDVNYLLNRDAFMYVLPGIVKMAKGVKPGITSFDDYDILDNYFREYGAEIAKSTVDRSKWIPVSEKERSLSDEERKKITDNVTQNVVELAKANPDIEFYYFFTPYSILFWEELYERGILDKQIETEKMAVELILTCDNIKLYSFNTNTDMTTDLDNYADHLHYGKWCNSDILKWMVEDKYRITSDNYMDYLNTEREFYSSYDYASIW